MSTHALSESELQTYGMVAEFSTPEAIVEAADKAREAGYTEMEGYTPFPVHGLDEALGFGNTRLGGSY